MINEPNGQKATALPQRGWPGVRARVSRVAGRAVRALMADTGTATIEFCMVVPIILFLVLILVQTTLLMVGNHFVHYAAFAATRSAIVYIPSENVYEPANVIQPHVDSPKYQAIRAAACLALVPVSGKLEQNSEVLPDGYVEGLHAYFASYGQDSPKWVDTLAAERLNYAVANTTVEIMETEVIGDDDVNFYAIGSNEDYPFGPRDAITVRVTHRLNLSVPYVRAIFDDGDHPDGNGKYTIVSAHYTLTNEGVITALPEQPELPRRD